MLGHLVPVAGGTSILLTRERVYLGRRTDAEPSAPLSSETALCRLRLLSGWWHVDDLACPTGVRVNGKLCKSQRLKPNDEVSIAGRRMRILYESPDDSLEAMAESVLGDKPVGRQVEAPLKPAAPVVSRPHVPLARRPEPDLLGRLVPLGGGEDFPLIRPRLTVGRSSECDIPLRYGTVSSQHCELELIDGYWQVRDLGSRNGIRVDGVPCEQAWLLPRSRLSIAEHRYQVDYTPQGPPPEPSMGDPAFKKPLMDKVGVAGKAWDHLLTRHAAQEQQETQKERYDLLGNL
jgi:adenylate cyclase